MNSELKKRRFYLKKILNKIELKVLRLILDGKRSEETIDLPPGSMKAIEFRRNRIYQKLGVDNLDDLFKVLMKVGR